jgi:hypothetical protein
MKNNIPYKTMEHNDQHKLMEEKQMATLKEQAQAYEPPHTKNIADLDKVSVDIVLQDGEAETKEGKKFTYKFFEYEGEEYRVPITVLKQMKAMLEKKPNLKYITVGKSGEGRDTTYTVMEADNAVPEEKVQ